MYIWNYYYYYFFFLLNTLILSPLFINYSVIMDFNNIIIIINKRKKVK